LKEGPATAGAAGEPIFFCGDTMRIMALIIPQPSDAAECQLYPPTKERWLKSVATTKKNTRDRLRHPF